MTAQPHALYRFYDSDDRLLYIGITADLGQRMDQHGLDKPWWCDVARVTVSHFPDRLSVLDAEGRAIKAERPLHNIARTGRPRSSRPAIVVSRPQTITLAEAADSLAVSTKTLRRYIASGRLTAYRLGSTAIRIDPAELSALLRPIPAAR